MNKMFFCAALLIASALNLQASNQQCTYEWSCIDSEHIIRVYFDGREEKIALKPGENVREEIRKLQEADKKDEWLPIAYTYKYDSRHPDQVIKTNCKTGQQEVIPVSPGKTSRQTAEELMVLEARAWLEFQKQRNK